MCPLFSISHREASGPDASASADSAHGYASEMDFIRYALDSAAIVAMTDVKGTITFVNSKFCEISGYTVEELIGANHRMLRSDVHDTQFFRDMYRCVGRGQVWHGEICNKRKDGSHYWVDTTIVPHVGASGKVDSYTAIRFDITARHEAEARLQAAVSLDPLTGIANRRRFHDYLEAALHEVRSDVPVHLALLDIDTFKEINDAFGHDIGDDLLRIVSERLSALMPPGCFVARLGGDEFGIVMTGMNVGAAIDFVETILTQMRRPVSLGAQMRRCTTSMGVAAFPRDAATLEDLFKAADMALYRAKALGRDRAKFFIPTLRETADRKAELRAAVENGLVTDQFLLHYQPIVPTDRKSAPISLEALLRWHHPERGLLTPGGFLVEIDDPGILAAIGMFVIERAFRDVEAMVSAGLPFGRVGINVTNADFRSDTFVDRFFELSEQRRVVPSRFCVEVTEGVFLGRDFLHLEGRLARLHEAGVEIALDDFGTGFASLTHLRRMPIDRVKIDRSFVSNLPDNAGDTAIIRGVVDIAHGMGKSVTAEGVETPEQARLLSALGCDFLQGWHFAHAYTPAQLPEVLHRLSLFSLSQPIHHLSSTAIRT